MKKTLTFSLAFLGQLLFAQYTTPNDGKTYRISDLDVLTDIITFDESSKQYLLTDDLIISSNDIFLADTDYTLVISEGKLITVAGKIDINAPKEVLFTSDHPGSSYFKGIRLEEGAIATFNHFKMIYGGGIRSLNETFTMDNSEISYQYGGTSTGGAINFSRGNPIIKNSTFKFNKTPAVGSGANQAVALIFENNHLEGNNQENSNRPQINMGPSGNNPTVIRGNTIIGDRALTRVGGVSVSSLLGVTNEAVIENNTIRDNRYGITISGSNSKGKIIGNMLENNNVETNPANGGSGISIYLASNPTTNIIDIFDNQIRGSLWGITNIEKGAFINLGTTERPGNNIFSNNGNGGIVYALYNNSVNNVSAIGNCWIENQKSTEEEVENVIVHQKDNSTLGLVDYSDFLCSNLSTSEITSKKVTLFPNPNNGTFTIETKEKSPYQIFDVNGRLVKQGELKTGKNTIQTGLSKGIYILNTNQDSSKIIVK
ncbi:T9SS type A sorting domain-containing protein [Empedobacter tilapiae]|uniref:T9SS type A sorting domain-containing protein n=1 Tax=Empedobacter tilapiae TaxID=2491114 RepID=A0A4Z1BWK5_9FLAO|nr:T9SS type A sorting domain-containing protein [Empedobacter tilapiae]TGN29309.1 T9SS type A sorting domain-containing protein [Empedobacter tilapiae]